MIATRLLGFGQAALLAALLASSATPAAAQSAAFDSLLSLFGVRDDDKPEIDYRERAPLVVPPKMELRQPRESLTKQAQNWPNDVDVSKRRKAAAEKAIPRTETTSYKLNEGKVLSVYEMRAGRVEGAGLNGPGPVNPYEDQLRTEFWNGPHKEQAKGKLAPGADKAKNMLAEQEPDRRFLTDPPTGYRAPSRNASLALPGRQFEPKLSDNDEASPWQFWRRNKVEE